MEDRKGFILTSIVILFIIWYMYSDKKISDYVSIFYSNDDYYDEENINVTIEEKTYEPLQNKNDKTKQHYEYIVPYDSLY